MDLFQKLSAWRSISVVRLLSELISQSPSHRIEVFKAHSRYAVLLSKLSIGRGRELHHRDSHSWLTLLYQSLKLPYLLSGREGALDPEGALHSSLTLYMQESGYLLFIGDPANLYYAETNSLTIVLCIRVRRKNALDSLKELGELATLERLSP